ncbi:adenylate cyclase type 9 [Contarinia nasturtii]|uniref:adenylate cyclase type 9 n=1 Tax=Contarinia nasturtii TaxID=265458 RepID=UPI0012D46685|nr:adenylate cyclase type 9 [Contarinia nasturtii]XP_031634034.1 adenylate cyclase type 9 [Contarinia nasturtii]XP_031634035.1 adenylate cyclase type 9 [Contarinia nasturtii]XP_031634036.1 adenylate cyclase type 9 [Contarinia nasturtii]XP_031634037.1 adenylate cyclase type 9 [Contarinia nasturtii]XP_031634038.1 adenylate cyclase type 9 [Contarinia nasturtii]XP_031634039.1 adenylate cyclase type 9 [Contarinia nasturtii]
MLSSYRLNHISNEDLQAVTFVPYKHAIFQSHHHHHHHNHRRQSCCSVLFPMAFERAAPKSILNPRFDSIILEGQYQSSVFPQIRLRYRYALIYVILSTLIWLGYHLSVLDTSVARMQLITLYASYVMVLLTSILLYFLTYTKFYRVHTTFVSIITTIILCGTSLTLLKFTSIELFSPLGHFSMCIEIILLIYTMIPFRLWQNCLLAAIYSILFEIGSFRSNDISTSVTYKIIVMRLMLHLCVHLIGLHILIMNVVRMRGTFIEVGQNLLVKRQLEMEKQLKEKMIHSVMPPRVADMLLKERSSGDQAMFGPTNVKCLFRPFHMASMDNVSILFADIVGFTKMSSKKTAEQLVEILNDLFERFDDLCILNGCEKISTLGDCYYCVAGCPEPRADHAICTVEMGLGMIAAMRLFDTKRHEGVTMRVGIHTGSVLCGIVGTQRVKFDVWSNDVSFANRMESTGRPGQIHISEKTYAFLENKYISEPGEEVEGLKTYYIIRRKSTKSYEHLRPNDLNLSSIPMSKNGETSNAPKLISQSATNLAVRHDSISPSALSTGAATSPAATANRCRSTTLNKLTRCLRSSVVNSGGNATIQAKDQSNQLQLSQPQSQQQQKPPQIFVSTKSLPESLTSTNPSILNCCPNSLTPNSRPSPSSGNDTYTENSKIGDSTIMTASDSVPNNKSMRQWKLPKYLRKFDSRNNNNDIKCDKDCVMNDGIVDETRIDNNDQSSYQLLPIIIQKANTETSLSAIDQNVSSNGNCFDHEHMRIERTASCSPSPRSNTHLNTDVIDVRSYISQSRSDTIYDITPFYPERADSCKYRTHRSYYGDVSPMRRPRSKTVAGQEHLSSKLSHEASINELRVPNARIRKHSHYCNSTSNNLQLPEIPPNHTSISQERLSTGDIGSWVTNISDDPTSGEQSSAIVIPANDEIHMDPLRKQSDLQLVKCVKENAKSQQNYLVTPPISKCSLFFLSPLMEKEFRDEAHQLNKTNGPLTIAFPIYNTYFDIFIGIIIFATVSIAMFLLSASERFNNTALQWLWLFLFASFSLIELLVLTLFTRRLFRNRGKSFGQQHKSQGTELQTNDERKQHTSDALNTGQTMSNTVTTSNITIDSIADHESLNGDRNFEDKIINSISKWYRWHISLGILMSLPAILTLVHFLISSMSNDASVFGCHYGFLMLISIVHFCNFTQLNCWMRNLMAVVVALAFIGGISMNQVEWSSDAGMQFEVQNTSLSPPMLILSDGSMRNRNESNGSSFVNQTQAFYDRKKPHCFEKKIDLEIYLDLTLVLILVWFLNREFEIFYRFAFYSSSIAEKDKVRVQQMKNQADLLLQNIIPRHVADHLKNTTKYSENHKNVGIIFASLINFNELYDESYLGGREYLRVLNELIGDFDELLSRPEFASVEKIKTIGSTFMAASGLDDSLRDQNSNGHINALMEFALAMQEVVAAFNKDLLEFDLILRIGFNVGDVTAGVIGTRMLHFDIWGDAVNVSSRMDSTGVAGQIQIGKDCIPFLDDQLYEFEPRGSVFVKGKDNMEVYLVRRKRH